MFIPLSHYVQGMPMTLTPVPEGSVISDVSRGGRRPTPDDAIADLLAKGEFRSPKTNPEISFHGQVHTWKDAKPGKDGWYEATGMRNGYWASTITCPDETDIVLSTRGVALVYIDGLPRAGDPYGYGYLNLPVHLKKGENVILVPGGRRFYIATSPVPKPIWLQPEDATLPDILTSDKDALYGSVVAMNATGVFTKGLDLKADLGSGESLTTHADPIPPYSIRKLKFKIPVPSQPSPGKIKLSVTLLRSDKSLDATSFDLQIKSPLELQKRTFVSQIDDSVQYYAARPALKPSKSNALVLTLHGASVEALGQAAAYASKDWASIVAATNRRPYGFDWEGIGRLDALEVLDIAKREYPHDPERVDLTGHSMGGHGTWSVGTLYPGLFASIAPSAGWISFWSYAGGWEPSKPSPTLDLLRRSMNVGDTLGRVNNTLSENVYILHGDADDNVPVEQARTMKEKLESIHHPHLEYHEQPGANHWWGNQCVDWPPLFEMIDHSKLDPNANHVDFTTQNPDASSSDRWVEIEQQEVCLVPSDVVADRGADGSVSVKTTNVAQLVLSDLKPGAMLKIDDQDLGKIRSKTGVFAKTNSKWQPTRLDSNAKNAQRGSGFKQVFNHRFAFVVGTHGTPEENEWALSRAIFGSEQMDYRGNGAVDIVLDRDFSARNFRGRNLILFGNADNNSAFKGLLKNCPVAVSEDRDKPGEGALLIYPKSGEKDTLIGVIGGNSVQGCKLTDRLALFSSGVDYPDWIKFSLNSPEEVEADGFFGSDWKLDPAQSAQAVNP